MANISASLMSGTGTPPKDIGAGSFVLLRSLVDTADMYTWELVSTPEASTARLENPIGSFTRLGPLSDSGVYLVYLYTNIGMYDQKLYTIALNVPGVISPRTLPDSPLFDTGGRVRNFSFELPGVSTGKAANWVTVDDANLLGTWGGTRSGRIVPIDFTVISGMYAMCLGDELADTSTFLVDDTFSVSQDVDFTGINTLSIQIKYKD